MATIPPATSPSAVCTVSIIDTTGRINGAPSSAFLTPPIAGHDILTTPIFSFLITHPATKTTVLFDLGLRPDWHNLSGALLARMAQSPWQAELVVPSSVPDILAAHGVPLETVDAIIWSHHHLDHVGDPSRFPAKTKLVVGKGVKGLLLPGFPAGAESPILEADYAGRKMVEVDFGDGGLEIAGLKAYDYFGDGALYLLDAPGHARGHLCALARVGDGGRFVLMAGDAFHHPGELRPSEMVPLPERIEPSPLDGATGCGCAMFRGLLDGDVTRSFYEPCGAWNDDVEEAKRTVRKLQALDGDSRVLVMAAHDETLFGAVDFFPGRVEVAGEKDPWREDKRWAFLKDFEKAVGSEVKT